MSEQKTMSPDEALNILDGVDGTTSGVDVLDMSGIYVHKFKKPFTCQGKTYEELTFDFGKLTLNDSLAVEDELNALGKGALVPEWNSQYLVRLAAKACTDKIGSDVLMTLPIHEGRRILTRTRNFIRR
ncbi:MAG TPA: hypothetical protein IAB47_07050 [Candidatus Scatomorpha merdigallinarum]|nr:hypothetical protein [Candidatus Scatomorpha merdigallinarum]